MCQIIFPISTLSLTLLSNFLRLNGGVVCVLVVGYIVNCYCLRLNGGVACDVVVGILLTITVYDLQRSGLCCCGWLYC